MNNKYVTDQGIHTNFNDEMTYRDYLQLDKLLSSQKLLSNHHDEKMFIIVHHVCELWLKLITHEMTDAIYMIQNDEFKKANKTLSRICTIQKQLIHAWDVLSTLTPADYMKFRNLLGNASGFQSYQYRLVEYSLGYKTPYILQIYKHNEHLYHLLKRAYEQPGLYDVTIQALARSGFSISKHVLKRDVTQTYEYDSSVEDAWLKIYQNVERYWTFYELAEKLVDIEDLFQQWRFKHMKTVERIIGYKKGTGGSSGVKYLKKVIEYYFFPELWTVRTKI